MATGYEDRRFQTLVDENLHCVICTEVLRDPVQCRSNEHHFCRNCITEHLKHSQNCPTCKDPLTVETLVRPQRFLANTLSNLKISCENSERGCRVVVELGSLTTHVASCEFNPVPCSNDQCDKIISRRDKEIHESKVCDFRPVECDYCSETVVYKNLMQHTCPQRREIREMKEEITALKRQLDTLCTSQDEMRSSLDEMRSSQDEMRSSQDEMRSSQDEMRSSQDEMRSSQDEMRSSQDEMRSSQDEMRSSQDEMRKMMKTMMSKIEGIVALSLRSETKPVSTSIHSLQAEIIVAGGCDDKSVEVFNMASKTWRLLSEMNECRARASSVSYQGHMIVTGGEVGIWSLDSVEELNLAQHDGHWIKSQFKLPLELQRHVCLVYQNRLLVIGGKAGSNFLHSRVCDSIYEIQLNPPYTSKLLTRMPRSVTFHGSELVNNKIYIFGGSTSVFARDAIDNVLMFDPTSNNFTELQPLPCAVFQMATITLKDNVVVVGGKNKESRVLDTVILYNVTTGSHRMLPSMKKKRYGCTAVIIDDNIVVMGGYGDDFKALNSVECYNFDTNTWTEFPAMIKARAFATAVVKYC